MGVLILIIIVVAVIYFVRKKSAGNSDAAAITTPVKHEIYFEDLTPEERAERNEAFNALMHGPDGQALAKCYNKIKSVFIPKPNGEFAGSMSGLLSNSTRAKTLVSADETVSGILGKGTPEYELWYKVLYDNLINEMYVSDNKKLAQLTEYVLEDVNRGHEILNEIGIEEILMDPDNDNSTITIDTDNHSVKIKIKTIDDVTLYEIQGAFESFKNGLCLDDALIHHAEILMAICEKYEYGPKVKFFKEEVEKYPLPNLRD